MRCDRQNSVPPKLPGILSDTTNHPEKQMSLGSILLLLIILMILGVIPTWPHSRAWGYRPSGVLGVALVVVLVLFLMGRI
jgi:cation transporter-like permease